MTGAELSTMTAQEITDLIAVKNAQKDAVAPSYYVSDLAAREFNMLNRDLQQLNERLAEIQA